MLKQWEESSYSYKTHGDTCDSARMHFGYIANFHSDLNNLPYFHCFDCGAYLVYPKNYWIGSTWR